MGRLQFGRTVLQELTKLSNSAARVGSGHTELPWTSIARGIRYRKQLECILTTDINKLGKAGEIVKVAPGYFRNHLMPKLLAVPNRDQYAYLIREQQKLYQRHEEEEKTVVVQKTGEEQMEEYKSAARRLDRGLVGLRRLVLNYGKELRYPVTKEELLAEVQRQLGVILQEENLVMPSNITMCGKHEILLRLPKSLPLPGGKPQISLKIKVQRK